jgi:hypothetical protein
LRLLDARPCHLSRSGAVDWSALLNLMTNAAQQGRDPFTDAVRAQERLFTTKPIFLGVEASLKQPDVPCGLKTDAERARHVRQLVREMLNSQGEWETCPALVEKPLSEIVIWDRPHPGPLPQERENISPPHMNSNAAHVTTGLENSSARAPLFLLPEGEGQGEGERDSQQNTKTEVQRPKWRSILSEPTALERVGTGTLCVLDETEQGKVYGRALTVAERLHDDRIIITKWVRRLTNWRGRQAPMALWKEKLAPLVEKKLAEQKTPVVRFVDQAHRIVAQLSLADLTVRAPVDSHGVALWRPTEREVLPYDCARCSLVSVCKQLPAATGVALLWRRLGLVDASGVPTRCGQVFSSFSQGDGLAITAALEDHSYPIDELIYDLANLDAGFRFCGEDNRWAGRLALVCHKKFGLQTIPGYLENGVPPKYGAGAEQVVASVHKNSLNKHDWVTDLLGPGDIDRVIIEWRSLLRQIAHAPDLDWPRWRALQAAAKAILNETVSPTISDLPPLEFHQTKRIDHRLILRRH